MSQLALPGKALRDAAHLAFACGYELDYLVPWNCTHIANAEIRRRLMAINAAMGRQTPIICTPEELMGAEETDYVCRPNGDRSPYRRTGARGAGSW